MEKINNEISLEPELNGYIAGSCIGEKCFCGKDAYHKVAEVVFDDEPFGPRHELTSYICCEHFHMLFGRFAKINCLINKHDTNK